MSRTFLTLIALPLLTLAASFGLPAGAIDETKPSRPHVTFTKDVAPIFFEKCATCHRPGEAAPMSILSFGEARPWAKSIREKVVSREMPPWHADPRYGEFKNDRRLTQSEIDTIVAWVDGGAKEGNPADLPPAPEFVEGWRIGKPDLVIQMPEEFTLAASGPDEYHYFEVETNFAEDRYVQMAEARPGNRKIVHHILAFVQPPGKDRPAQNRMTKEAIEKLREKMERESVFYRDGFLMRMKPDVPIHDDGCQLPTDASDRAFQELGMVLCGFAPGMNAATWEPGTAKKIPAGSRIIFQVHYSKAAGSVQKDRSMVGLLFAKQPPERQIITQPIVNRYFKIPPGAPNHKSTACWTTQEDIRLINLMPHMHLRGKAMEIRAFYPDGRDEILLDVPNYSFSWQTVYYLKQPLAIPKGTRFLVTGYFDNSAKNKYNPDPTRSVRFGEPSYDEMLAAFVEYSVERKPLEPVATSSSEPAARE